MKRFISLFLAITLFFTLAATVSARLLGDVDSDGKVNSSDALLILKHAVGEPIAISEYADINKDGLVNSSDALIVLKIVVGSYVEEEENKAPTAPAEIVNYYNNALNKVINEKVGYKKARDTKMNSLEGGALLKIQLVVDMVNDFLGVGTTDYENKKGKAEFLSKASLSVNDLTAARCDVIGDVYTITLGLKNGQSQATAAGSSDTSPLQRSGLYVGKGDKKAFDYKNSENIHTAINGVDDCTAESASEQVSNAKIVATINSKTGQMTDLTVSWDWAVQLTKVKYTVVTVKEAKGTATSVVKVSNFQW